MFFRFWVNSAVFDSANLLKFRNIFNSDLSEQFRNLLNSAHSSVFLFSIRISIPQTSSKVRCIFYSTFEWEFRCLFCFNQLNIPQFIFKFRVNWLLFSSRNLAVLRCPSALKLTDLYMKRSAENRQFRFG